MDDGRAAQVEQVFAHAAIAGAWALPAADVRQAVLDRDAFPQFGPPGRGVLTRAQLDQQPLVGVDRDTAAVGATGAARAERAGRAGRRWELDHLAGVEGEAHLVRATDRALLPVQFEGTLREGCARSDRPGLAIDLQARRPLADQATGQVRAVDVQLAQVDLLRSQVGDDGVGHL